MKKHALIKNAYDIYPKGTKIKSFDHLQMGGITEKIEFESTGKFEFDKMGNILAVLVNSKEPIYLSGGMWAPIISDKLDIPKIGSKFMTEDGVPLSFDEPFTCVYQDGPYWCIKSVDTLKLKSDVICKPERFKAFASTEKARLWCSIENKKAAIVVSNSRNQIYNKVRLSQSPRLGLLGTIELMSESNHILISYNADTSELSIPANSLTKEEVAEFMSAAIKLLTNK